MAAGLPERRDPVSRVTCVRARARYAAARFARLIAPARVGAWARAQGARLPSVSQEAFFRTGAKREAKRPRGRRPFLLLYPITDLQESSAPGIISNADRWPQRPGSGRDSEKSRAQAALLPSRLREGPGEGLPTRRALPGCTAADPLPASPASGGGEESARALRRLPLPLAGGVGGGSLDTAGLLPGCTAAGPLPASPASGGGEDLRRREPSPGPQEVRI